MSKKIITKSSFFSICFLIAWTFQIQAIDNGFQLIRDAFVLLDSALNISNVTPPPDTAKIKIPLYPPSLPTDTSTDKDHRIGAIEAWSRDDYPGIIDSLKKVKHPNDVDRRLLVNLYYRLDSLNQALEMGEKIVERDAETLYALGLIAMEVRDYEMAAHHFQNAIDLKPSWTRLRARLGDAHFLDSQHEQALSNWLSARMDNYHEPYLNYFLGYLYFEKGDFEEALNYFEQIGSDESTNQWIIRARYFQAIIKERTEGREAAIEVLSEIELHTIGMSEIEYDILKKKIYSHFWLGLKYYKKDRKLARNHFINAGVSISSNSARFVGDDKIIVELLRGVVLRLREQLRGMRKYLVSNQYFNRYTNEKISEYQSGEVNGNLMRLSAEVLYLCKETSLSARFFDVLRHDNPISQMNYYVLQPNSMHDLPELIWMKEYPDTLRPYILFNYMSIAFQKSDFELADSLYYEVINELIRFDQMGYHDNLLYHSLSYRAIWLKELIKRKPTKAKELAQETEKINKVLNDMVRKNENLVIPVRSFYLSNGHIFIIAIKRQA